MKKILYLITLLITYHFHSQNKSQLNQTTNYYGCRFKKTAIIEKRLDQKGYYGKAIQIENVVTLTKHYSVDPDDENSIQIEITNALKTGNPSQEEISSLNSKSIQEVFLLLKDLKKVLLEKHNTCNLKEYYIRINYRNLPKYFEYEFEYKQLIELLKDINNELHKAEIIRIISQQQTI